MITDEEAKTQLLKYILQLTLNKNIGCCRKWKRLEEIGRDRKIVSIELLQTLKYTTKHLIVCFHILHFRCLSLQFKKTECKITRQSTNKLNFS